MNRFVITGLFLLLSVLGFSQGEFNIWYFGVYAGISFNSIAPVALPPNPMSQGGSTAGVSVSDSSGNIMFYSDGRKIWNRNNQVMESGLLGGEVACQFMAVQDVSNHNLYYLFTVGHLSMPIDTGSGLYYSVIDMQLNGGLGNIVPGMKNIPMSMGDSARVGLTAIRHQNNRDAWVVVLRRGIMKQYLAFLIDSSGLNHTPVVSTSTLKNSYLPGVVFPVP